MECLGFRRCFCHTCKPNLNVMLSSPVWNTNNIWVDLESFLIYLVWHNSGAPVWNGCYWPKGNEIGWLLACMDSISLKSKSVTGRGPPCLVHLKSPKWVLHFIWKLMGDGNISVGFLPGFFIWTRQSGGRTICLYSEVPGSNPGWGFQISYYNLYFENLMGDGNSSVGFSTGFLNWSSWSSGGLLWWGRSRRSLVQIPAFSWWYKRYHSHFLTVFA